jgi:hypothetical protein
MNDVVKYELDGKVAWLTIDRPEARNALSKAVRDGLWAGFRTFAEDDDAAVLVLTGAGEKAFCAGGDLKEMAGAAMGIPPADFLPYLQRSVKTDKPVIAAVNGVAFAGGFLLAQMVDLVIAADHAKFGITEAKVGRGAPWAAPLPWLIPPRVAMEMLVTAEPISAPTSWGSSTRSSRWPSCATPRRRWPRASRPTRRSRCARPSPWSTCRPSTAGPPRSTPPTSSTSRSTSATTPRRARAPSARSASPSGRGSNR